MQAEKKKRDLRISAVKDLEPEVINDRMIKEYIDTFNLEKKIFDQENLPLSQISHLALSFKSNTFKQLNKI